MIDRQKLLSDLQGLLRTVEADLLARSEDAELPEVSGWLKAEYESAKEAGRTAQTLKSWVDDFVTQVAAAWVLSCVFVRYLEDNSLVDPPRLSGPASDAGGGQSRLKRARDEYDHWVQNNRGQTDREYLLDVFARLARLPAAGEVFGPHNPLNALPNWLSGDAARAMLAFFQKVDSDTGEITHDFTDASGDTRFLGDLYQDLSEAARKKYALLQTPDFVEEFILDRTLEPALDEFGLTPQPQNETGSPRPVSGRGAGGEGLFRMIDPACGSGHFLLGAFPRILDRWLKKEPGEKIRVLVQRALDSIHGVDVNPYAVAIARFRLLLAALSAEGIKKLKDAPAYRMHLACGDSLYHGRQRQLMLSEDWTDESHFFQAEDSESLRQILKEGTFHAVVANPPYITPKDTAANAAYRDLYNYCYGQYQLVSPFLERLFLLGTQEPAAYVGAIIGNAFTRADFGKNLVEQGFPNWDVTHVIDTSGAYIPNHGNPDGTPTLLLFARDRKPVSNTVRTLISIRSEQTAPSVLSEGLAWQEILSMTDVVEEGSFIQSLDIERQKFHRLPWPITGDSESTVIDRLNSSASTKLCDAVLEVGRSTHTGEDDAYCMLQADARRMGLHNKAVKLVEGKDVRDFVLSENQWSLFPYDLATGGTRDLMPGAEVRHYWTIRTVLRSRKDYGQTPEERGLRWYEHSMFFPRRYQAKHYLCFAFTATHNHFVLSNEPAIFKQTSPLVVFHDDSSSRFRTMVFGLLNSSVVCFWMRQHGFPRGGFSEGKWQERFNFNNTCLESLPFEVDPNIWTTS